ncbi:GspE/PulE family protein [Aliarcobacter vitoriensis]|uniref:GspE/PulE family protein n=1 Tax=Aliarcobacter vitoriensis TaxID=2011099 RepID=UPI003AB09696
MVLSILKILIDYSLFEKYDQEYFIKNLIVPICEDSISLKFAVCKNSNLTTIKDDFVKLLTYVEVDEFEILFILSNLESRKNLYKIAQKSTIQNSSEKYTAQFLDELILYSIEQRASDIHIEKFKDLVLFKFRVDGRLKIFFSFEAEFFKIFSSFVKLISNLDMTQTRLALDGRFTRYIDDKKYDFRLSTMPTIEAESIVLRILDNKNIDKNLQTLGLSEDIYSTLFDVLKLTQGLILISGPTGSGKTTTLYSILKELNSDEKKIITVEDPIEYKIDSINQVPINNKVGLSFEVVLKNILRQDPDIIFIGEIRDKFSLDIALQASLTGHLVLASIHSSNCLETITRLIDLKADPFLISTTLKAIMAQRLVLTYCKNCMASGCKKCNFTKFYDRSSIAEILKVDEKISSLIFQKASLNEFKEYLKTINFKTMLDDGKEKVDKKITNIDEVYKVVNF